MKFFTFYCLKCGSKNVKIQNGTDYLGDKYTILICNDCGSSEEN